IRDDLVTGVQTCALPIYVTTNHRAGSLGETFCGDPKNRVTGKNDIRDGQGGSADAFDNQKEQEPSNVLQKNAGGYGSRKDTQERSEERRVGKEWRDAGGA